MRGREGGVIFAVQDRKWWSLIRMDERCGAACRRIVLFLLEQMRGLFFGKVETPFFSLVGAKQKACARKAAAKPTKIRRGVKEITASPQITTDI